MLAKLRSARARHVRAECCQICLQPLDEDHEHVVDLRAHALLCACVGCYAAALDGEANYRAVPDRYLSLEPVVLNDELQRALGNKTGVVFISYDSLWARHAAFVPGPDGAAAAEVDPESLSSFIRLNLALAELEPDVEACLVHAVPASGEAGEVEAFIVPLDICYELSGHLASHWRGRDGGREAHGVLEAFLRRLRAQTR